MEIPHEDILDRVIDCMPVGDYRISSSGKLIAYKTSNNSIMVLRTNGDKPWNKMSPEEFDEALEEAMKKEE